MKVVPTLLLPAPELVNVVLPTVLIIYERPVSKLPAVNVCDASTCGTAGEPLKGEARFSEGERFEGSGVLLKLLGEVSVLV